MPRLPRQLAGTLPYALLFAAALVVGLELARPFGAASVAFDSQSAVLYFERIASGQRLEQPLTTTPKPVLTLVFGVLYELTHDWRMLAWTTLLVDAVAVVLMALLARRVAGPIAAAFTGTALVNNGNLLFDVGYALASPYALLGWTAAGLALTAPRPRYAVAGVALALAALARVETFVLIGASMLGLAVAALVPPRWGIGTPPRRAWLLPVIGLLALPVMLLHDWALTGDPLYWAGVAPRYAAATTRQLAGPMEIGVAIVGRYWAMGGASALAIVGVVQLLGQRRHWILVALAGLGPGIAAFLVLLGARGVDVPIRYTVGVDVAVVFAAGVGVGAIALRLAPWAPLERFRARLAPNATAVAGAAAVVVLALLVTGPYWRQNEGIRSAVRTSLRLAADADRAVPAISAALSSPGTSSSVPGVLVPGAIRPRIVLDLGLSLADVGGTAAAKVDLGAGYPARGQIVFHDRTVDPASPGWAQLEVSERTSIGSVVVDPLLVDDAAGIWVVAVR